MNLEFMGELLKTAKEYNVTICLENMPWHRFSMATPEMTLKFVREMNDENFKMCLDTGHAAVFSDLKIGDELRRVKDEVRVLHVHDNKGGHDLHMFPYFGVADWDDFGKALRDIDFKGVLSLETMPPAKLPTDIFESMCIDLAKIAKNIIGE